MRWPFHYFIKTVCYLAASAAFLLIFLFCISYAIGVATNSVEYVPPDGRHDGSYGTN